MCRNYSELEFKHFIFVTADGTIFGSAREDGHIYNFLIHGGSVRTQSRGQWIELETGIAEVVRERAEAVYVRVPIYKTASLCA